MGSMHIRSFDSSVKLWFRYINVLMITLSSDVSHEWQHHQVFIHFCETVIKVFTCFYEILTARFHRCKPWKPWMGASSGLCMLLWNCDLGLHMVLWFHDLGLHMCPWNHGLGLPMLLWNHDLGFGMLLWNHELAQYLRNVALLFTS